MIRSITTALALLLTGCGTAPSTTATQSGQTDMTNSRELIVVAAPKTTDPYYRDTARDIFEFHLAYAKAIEAGGDDFLVLTDKESQKAYSDAVGPERVLLAPQEDIWLRDFSLSNATSPIMFRYTAEGQGGGRRGQSDADNVQETLAELIIDAGLEFRETDLLNDGGNFVDDYEGRAVVSRKFLNDNDLTESEARAALRSKLGLNHISFIEADEQGGLEHADGVAAFIDPNVLVINSYPEDDDYAVELVRALRVALPEVRIHEIVTPYDDQEVYDERFGSACGLYTNMLVTPQTVYLPQFGIPEDAEALASVRNWTSKTVIPVSSDEVCHMGGGVRCMSWQLRGTNAERLRAYALSKSER